jgi:hypothetical protein
MHGIFLAKFRLSASNMEEERERYNNIPREDRKGQNSSLKLFHIKV